MEPTSRSAKQVGAENFFLFGLNAEEVSALKAKGYNPCDYYNTNGTAAGY